MTSWSNSQISKWGSNGTVYTIKKVPPKSLFFQELTSMQEVEKDLKLKAFRLYNLTNVYHTDALCVPNANGKGEYELLTIEEVKEANLCPHCMYREHDTNWFSSERKNKNGEYLRLYKKYVSTINKLTEINEFSETATFNELKTSAFELLDVHRLFYKMDKHKIPVVLQAQYFKIQEDIMSTRGKILELFNTKYFKEFTNVFFAESYDYLSEEVKTYTKGKYVLLPPETRLDQNQWANYAFQEVKEIIFDFPKINTESEKWRYLLSSFLQRTYGLKLYRQEEPVHTVPLIFFAAFDFKEKEKLKKQFLIIKKPLTKEQEETLQVLHSDASLTLKECYEVVKNV